MYKRQGSNFPVRKKEKQNAARDKNMGEYMQIEGLLDKVRSTGMGGISADDDRALEKLEAKLAGLEAMQEEMKTVNAYFKIRFLRVVVDYDVDRMQV